MSSISTILTRWNGWNEEALQCAFLRSLNKQVKDELGLKDESDSLDTLVSLAIRLDNCMREKRRQRASHSHASVVPHPPLRLSANPAWEPQPGPQAPAHSLWHREEAMKLGRARLPSPPSSMSDDSRQANVSTVEIWGTF